MLRFIWPSYKKKEWGRTVYKKREALGSNGGWCWHQTTLRTGKEIKKKNNSPTKKIQNNKNDQERYVTCKTFGRCDLISFVLGLRD